jgi:hypothetical protein
LKLQSILCSVVVLGLAASAQAVPVLSIVDDPGVLGVIPGGAFNDLLSGIYGDGSPRAGHFGASIKLTGPATLVFTFLGEEAAYSNKFFVNDDLTFHNNTTAAGTTFVGDFDAGLLDFYFKINGVGPLAVNCKGMLPCNPRNIGARPNFFTSFDGVATATSGNSLVLFLDDGGGNNDDDFDDMAIRIAVVADPVPDPIPEPGSMLLLSSGLAALWAGRRRNS